MLMKLEHLNWVIMMQISEKLYDLIRDSDEISDKTKKIFKNCMENTLSRTLISTDRDDYFVITGDIPAMWLRDSSGQIKPLFYLDIKEADDIIKKVIKRQLYCLDKDLYANAFNMTNNGKSWDRNDITEWNDHIWERKYELDSICYPLDTIYMYYEKTGDLEIFDNKFFELLNKIINMLIVEQHHLEKSTYHFERPNPYVYYDTLANNGKGSNVAYTGMSWSGFRPSDDACTYQYLIPSNFYLVKVLGKLIKIMKQNFSDKVILIEKMEKLKNEVKEGIEKYAIFEDSDFGKIYAYEVDGLGNSLCMDDANVPSLLSLPYLECVKNDDIIYENTRKFVLSSKNPYYYEGTNAKGIGSPHTPKNYIWHIALSIQSMTEKDKVKQKEILDIIEKTDADKFLMHEGFNKDNHYEYTRDWFSWSNSLYCEAVLKYLGFERIRKQRV